MAWSTVACSEEHGSRQESFSRDGGPQFSVKLRCNWSSRYDLIGDILGTPRPWPESPFGGLYAQNASAVPVPNAAYIGADQQMVYDNALVTVTYGSMAGADIVSETLEPTVEFTTLDYRQFRWGSKTGDPLLEAEAQGFQIRGHSIVRTLYHLSAVHSSYLTLNGKVNQSQYVSALLGLTYPSETLLFTPGPISRRIRTDGTDGFTAQIRFTYKADGWNAYWRAKTQEFEQVYHVDDDDPYKSYEPANFSNWLF